MSSLTHIDRVIGHFHTRNLIRSISLWLRAATRGDFTSPSAAALQFVLLMLVAFAGNYSLFSFSPLQETIKLAQGFSDSEIAVLQGPAFYGPMIIASVPMGILMGRFSQSRLITLFLALCVLGTVGTALAPSFVALAISRFVVGAAGSGISMAASALIARLIKPAFHGRAFWLTGSAQVAGSSAAFAVGGKLAAVFGPSTGGWRYAALWLALPLAIITVVALLLREPNIREGGANRSSFALPELRALWEYRGVMLPLMAAPIIVNSGVSAANTWAAPIFARTFQMHPDQVGRMMGAAILLSGVTGSGFGGILSDYCRRTGGPRRIISFLTVLALLNLAAGFFGMMPTAVSAIALLFLLYFLAAAKGITSTTATAAVIPAHLLGVSFGIQVTAYCIVLAIAPVAVSTISNHISGGSEIGPALAIVCGVTSLGALLVYLPSRRYFASNIDSASRETKTSA